MHINNNHIINQLRLEAEVSNHDQGFRVRHQLASYWQEWLVSYIDMAFDRLSLPDEIIRIERLEIDLGEVFYDDFEQQFKSRFAEKFETELLKQNTLISSKNEPKNQTFSDLELFENFLKTGRFSWREVGTKRSIGDVLKNIFMQDKVALKLLFEQIFKSKHQIVRLLYQFDNKLLIGIFVELFKLESIVFFAENIFIKFPQGNYLNGLSSKQQTEILLECIIDNFDIISNPIADFEKVLSVKILDKIEAIFGGEIYEKTAENYSKQETRKHAFEEEKFNGDLSENAISEYQKTYTSHAGLILIAPFLPQIFKKLNLFEGDNFRNDESKFQAIHLLNYMATGEKSAEEHELSLEKLLCGVAFHIPIPKEVELTEKDIFEANELLKSVLEHWKPLNNTSIEGFRSSFLMREGIVYDESQFWKLRVERKSYDMLLDVISWGFSYIKFSWTPKPIQSEW